MAKVKWYRTQVKGSISNAKGWMEKKTWQFTDFQIMKNNYHALYQSCEFHHWVFAEQCLLKIKSCKKFMSIVAFTPHSKIF